ncbi:MAG: RNA-directed DNA polymerase [Planctomycetes bacterium]|nr:RNA-directed DNA polymerase [Planctomycetota bacterium]
MGLISDFFKNLFGSPVENKGGENEPTQKSAGNDSGPSELTRLEMNRLPLIAGRAELLQELQISDKELDWFVKHPEWHYTVVSIPKKSGGARTIYAPKKRMKRIQRWILSEILSKARVEGSAHGFAKGRSITTNAFPHTGTEIIVNIDLENFFDSVKLWRVYCAFRNFGYSGELSSIFARLCCVKGALRQGLPTSPALTNVVCAMLDRRLNGLAVKFGCTYTRYADDMTFSGDLKFKASLSRFIPILKKIIRGEKFKINRSKMRITRKGSQQKVTGLVVNEKVNIPREKMRLWRAIIHNCRIKGLESQNRDKHKHFAAHLKGLVSFAAQVAPAKSERMREELSQVTKP